VSLGGGRKAGDDAHRRRFPAPVGAEKADDLALLRGEGDLIDGEQIP
jgi:hypothetical protein